MVFDALNFLTTIAQGDVGMKNCATLRLRLELGLRSEVVQHLSHFGVVFTERTLAERLLLWLTKKGFFDLRSIVVVLALT